jgi:dynein regulatory complex subunit 2
MEQSHLRDVARKDAAIRELMHDVDVAEEQFLTARRAHTSALDRLVDLQDSRLAAMEDSFQQQLDQVRSTLRDELAELEEQHRREVLEHRHLEAILEEDQAKHRKEAQDDFEQRREGLTSASLERIHQLQSVMDSSIDGLSAEFERAHTAYVSATDARTRQYKALVSKANKGAEKQRDLLEREERLKRELQLWKAKLASISREEHARLRAMTDRKLDVITAQQRLKGKIDSMRAKAAARLRHLSFQCASTAGDMADKVRLAERILLLAEKCRSLESVEEKVSPLVDESLPEDEEAKALEGPAGDGVDELQTEVFGPFLRRFNKAKLESFALEAARDQERAANEQLRGLLREFLDGVSFSDHTLESKNTLLVVNDGPLALAASSGAANKSAIDASAHFRSTLKTRTVVP